jgi:hypothetical protein
MVTVIGTLHAVVFPETRMSVVETFIAGQDDQLSRPPPPPECICSPVARG